MDILILKNYEELVARRTGSLNERSTFACTQEEDEILIRAYLRFAASHAAIEIRYKQQLKAPASWKTPIWGEYLPNISPDRLTTVLAEELELKEEIINSNFYHLTLEGGDPFKEEEKTLDNYLPHVTPDPEEEYSANTKKVIDHFSNS